MATATIEHTTTRGMRKCLAVDLAENEKKNKTKKKGVNVICVHSGTKGLSLSFIEKQSNEDNAPKRKRN